MDTAGYDQDILLKLQQTELEILKDFQTICRKHHLVYFATCGTVIGAVRHQGFIPWDDDIDVCMLRDDYKRFMAVAPQEMGDKYVFMDAETEPKYPWMSGKMIKKGTKFIEASYQQLDYPSGIFIDIFPYDQVPMDLKARTKIAKKAWRLASARVIALIPDPNVPQGMKGIMRKLVPFGCKVLHNLFKLIRLTPEKITQKYLKLVSKCPEPYSDMFMDLSYIYIGEHLKIRIREAFPLIELPFEDTTVAVVKNYDAFLRVEYGDYMQLPPEEDRYNHLAAEIDFGNA